MLIWYFLLLTSYFLFLTSYMQLRLLKIAHLVLFFWTKCQINRNLPASCILHINVYIEQRRGHNLYQDTKVTHVKIPNSCSLNQLPNNRKEKDHKKITNVSFTLTRTTHLRPSKTIFFPFLLPYVAIMRRNF